ncbi:thiol:disulfide interchange protein [Stappia sp. 22II-S9-Z10]|nr:thiol:disulfide interchange protein [Stappia sp. 22II-S9-Z10]
MTMLLPRLLSALAVGFAALTAVPAAHAGEVAAVAGDHVAARVLLKNAATAPGETVDVALAHRLDAGWHTYWVNPGDSGGPPVVTWTLDGGAHGETIFPAPKRLPYPPLMNHGYSDSFTLLTSLTVPADWPAGRPWPVTLAMDWLVCEKICIPASGTATFDVPTAAASAEDPAVAYDFVEAGWDIPAKSDVAATYVRDGASIRLMVPGADAGVASGEDAHFFAFNDRALDHVADQPAVVADGALTLTLTPGRGRLTGELGGVLTTSKGAIEIVADGPADPEPVAAPAIATASTAGGVGASGAGASGAGASGGGGTSQSAALSFRLPVAAGKADAPPAGPAGLGMWQVLGLAFLGGIILNLMPCVFPVLAVKALGLVSHAAAPWRARAATGAAYMAGILVSLMAVAAAMLALRAGGEAVGWGFQLQSPAFVAAMTLILFAFGLNLSGVYEIGASFTRLGTRGGTGPAAAFSTGLLATVVATPCTAPFMAPAMGAALIASPAFALAVFAALGLGLALPFVLLSLMPGLARVLPKPGLWMVRFKQALAFPLYLTAAWLFWVLAQLVSVESLLPAMAALVLLAMAAWLYGLSQRGSGSSHRVAFGLAAGSLALALAALWPAVGPSASPAMALGRPDGAPLGQRIVDGGAEEAFSPARLAQLRAEGRPVFLNVTAAWCITCKVNERVVLSGDDFRAALEARGVTYMKADWTRRDPEVTHLIEEFGRAGVPLYVYFPAGADPVVLPQLLSDDTLRAAFAS